MLSREVMDNNCRSWSELLVGMQRMRDGEPLRDWKPSFMRRVIHFGIEAGWNKYFRIGQALDQIIFSTCEQHGLERYSPPPARVTVAKHRGEYSIAYSHEDVRDAQAERRDVVTYATVLPVLRSYLIELWQETRPGEPGPELDLPSEASGRGNSRRTLKDLVNELLDTMTFGMRVIFLSQVCLAYGLYRLHVHHGHMDAGVWVAFIFAAALALSAIGEKVYWAVIRHRLAKKRRYIVG